MHNPVMIGILSGGLLLSGCMTTGADPERFSALSCKALSDLSRAYTQSASQIDLFNDNDINELERTNTQRRILGQSSDNLRPYEKAREKDINSIRAASRLKRC